MPLTVRGTVHSFLPKRVLHEVLHVHSSSIKQAVILGNINNDAAALNEITTLGQMNASQTLLNTGMSHLSATIKLLLGMLRHGVLPWGKMPQFALDFIPFVDNSKNLLCPFYVAIAPGKMTHFAPTLIVWIYGRKRDYLDEKVTNEDDFFC
jgi:hypothetical protein